MLKWVCIALMLGVLIAFSVLAVSAHFPHQRRTEPVFISAFLFHPLTMLTFIFSFYRLYRIRRKEGKKHPLPPGWTWEEELWNPMRRSEKLCVIAYICVASVAAIALVFGAFTVEQKFGSLIVFGAALGFPALSFIFAAYRASDSDLTEKGI